MDTVIYVGAQAQARHPRWTHVAVGAIAIGFGVFVLRHPGTSASEFPHAGALVWLTCGVITTVESILFRPSARGGHLTAGLLAILAAMLILGQPPLATSISSIALYVFAVMLALVSGALQLAVSVLGSFDPGHLLMGVLQVLVVLVATLAPVVRGPGFVIPVQFLAVAAMTIGGALLFARSRR